MKEKFQIYNTLTRKKEVFEAINPPHVGIYVCGPTVYGDPHLGHARPAITFDVLFRYLKFKGYKVRYVRNITDVGHLENDADSGEDKIARKARIEQLEPMEVVQYYTYRYHKFIEMLNVLPPSIEPVASGHIIEQQELVEKIIENGYAYESNGSVYFDVEEYNKKYIYGKLSGRRIEELMENTRELAGQEEKHNNVDFAIWKKAGPQHIMRWKSKWSEGFPGWHLECSAMSTKYLGYKFDIHGGGMDLLFPHHECEISQTVAAFGQESVKYWMHNNMITINGQKMAKSLGNFINLEQLFTGNHPMLQQAYSPMTIRFFILQAHYRGTLDFSNEALQAADKGLQRLFAGINTLEKLKTSDKSTVNINELSSLCLEAMDDDMNTPILISHLFDGVRMINSVAAGNESLTQEDLSKLKKLYGDFVTDILGLTDEKSGLGSDSLLKEVVDLLLHVRMEAKAKKDYATSDKIRNNLTAMGFEIKDSKDGFDWELP
ncbi:MAG: cysteine--tRNA ligase [Bacteroidia bacterium]|nr:cysteine--tRNA ligase [Bacteroidia bacterium]